MEFDEKNERCKKCGSFRPWIIIKNKDGDHVKRKCEGCEVLKVYKFVEYKNLIFSDEYELSHSDRVFNTREEKTLCSTVYEPLKDQYVILGD